MLRLIAVIALIFSVTAISAPRVGAVTYSYSFEGGFEGWVADECDADGDYWHVELSQVMAYEGSWSLEYYIINWGDATKVWIEKPYLVPLGRQYTVSVSFRLASQDFGDFNIWSVIASVSPNNPETRFDFVTIGDTRSGGEPGEWIWLLRSHSKLVDPANNPDMPGWGTIWVGFGIWGTWETPRTYYVDSATITIDSAPQTVSIPEAKSLPDETYIRLDAKVVTSGTGDLAGRIYVAEPDRTSGIAVELSSAEPVEVGNVISVSGVLGSSNGERVIKNASLEGG